MSLFFSARIVLIASSKSSYVAHPVDMITGLFFDATYLISGISVISYEAIL